MVNPQTYLTQARLLNDRLERISADSIWAHRSSGLRGSLLRWIVYFENQTECQTCEYHLKQVELQNLDNLFKAGYLILENAARERLK